MNASLSGIFARPKLFFPLVFIPCVPLRKDHIWDSLKVVFKSILTLPGMVHNGGILLTVYVKHRTSLFSDHKNERARDFVTWLKFVKTNAMSVK